MNANAATSRPSRAPRIPREAGMEQVARSDLSVAACFLNFMARGAGPLHTRTFSDKKGLPTSGQNNSLSPPVPPASLMVLDRTNAAGHGVFVVVNAGGQKTDSIDRIRALFVDYDGDDLAGFEHCLTDLPPPHIIVESSPGKRHVYWKCEGVPVSEFRALQEGLIAQLGTDPSIKDLPRVMRVPGFLHQKGEPFRSRILELHEDLPPYTLEQCRKFAKPKKAGEKALTPTRAPRTPRTPRAAPVVSDMRVSSNDNNGNSSTGGMAAFFDAMALHLPEPKVKASEQHAYDVTCVQSAMAFLTEHGDAKSYAGWQGVGADLKGCTCAEDGATPVLTDQEAFDLFDIFSEAAGDAYDPDGVEDRWDTLGDAIIGPAALLARAKGIGWQMPPHPRSQTTMLQRAMTDTAPLDLARATGDDVFIRNGKGALICNAANATAFLANAERTKESFRYNELTLRIEFCEAGRWRELEDKDALALMLFMQRSGLPRISKEDVIHGIKALALSYRTHPLREWLHGLKWDGQKCIDRWLNRYLGVPRSEYARLVGRFFLLAMVARVMKPGCKVDTMLVLEGPQGAGKSSALRVLAGDDYFSDGLADIRGKEASQALRGRWLVEIAEMAASSKAEAESIKAFLSRQSEHYRPPFERLEVNEPRQCVLAGTTNDAQYLRDATGARRFWPVEVGQIDTTSLAADREQLFAEAVELFKAGERWWPTAEEQERLFSGEQEKRQEEDPWEDAVRDYLDQVMQEAQANGKQPKTTVADVGGCRRLNLELGRTTTAHNRRIVNILTKLGWEQHRTTAARFYVPSR